MSEIIYKYTGTSLINSIGEFYTGGYRTLEKDNKVLNHLLLYKKQNLQGPIKLRIQSGCLTGNIFGDTHCDCQEQLEKGMEYVHSNEDSLLIYTVEHDGRGRGTIEKMNVYKLREEHGINSEQACEILGLPYENRDYTSIANILKDLKLTDVILLSSDKHKRETLINNGIVIKEYENF